MSERLIRALQKGGCLVVCASGWGVLRSRDRRARRIGTLSRAAVESLKAQGQVTVASDGEGDYLVWSGPAADLARTGRAPGPGSTQPVSRAAKRSSLDIVLASLGEERERALARAALGRLEGDLERAASGQRVTQSWDLSMKVDGVASRREGGRMDSAVRAGRRVEAVRAALGERNVALVWEIAFQGRSLAAIAADRVSSRDVIIHAAGRALMSLVEAYRFRVPAAP